jgi:predicted Zn finger-like uncharacterized protein
MDVRCERCGTEYEFDDALVSDRGTSVKCTECQHEFRVMPSTSMVGSVAGAADGAAGGDEWAVSRASGGTVVFTSLRDLQEAIRGGDLGRDDTVVRPGRTGAAGRPRALGSISELEHLFPAGHDPRLPPMRSRIDTLRPDPVASVPPPPDDTDGVAQTRQLAALKPGAASTLLIGALSDMAIPTPPAQTPPAMPAAAPAKATAQHAHTVPLFKGTPIADEPPASTARPPVLHDLASDSSVHDLDDESSPLPPSARVPISVAPRSLRRVPTARELLAGDDSDVALGDARADVVGHEAVERLGSGRRVGGWVVALALVAGAGVVGFIALRPYLLGARAPTAAAPTAGGPIDPQATELSAAGERAYAAGDLDTAKDDLEKASALAPVSPRIALDRARTSAALADVAWLRARLLPTGTTSSDRAAAERRITELSQAAETTSATAVALAPGEAASTRARVDALRLAGKLPEARAAASPLAASSSDPETAYVLAALDAADPQPLWGTVVDRLRVAASAEGELGRARALLVYALARAGDTAGAGRELDKLAAFTRPHPLLAPLRAFVDAAKTQIVGVGVGATQTSVPLNLPKEMDVSALPRTSAAPAPPKTVPGAGDNRALDAQADAARRSGDYERAGKLYSQALDRNANDSEALGGLGAVAHAKGDWEGAKASYRRALIVNPQFLPALIGLADVEWESGDKSAAEQTYHEITQRFPGGSYPKRVKERADGTSGAAAGASGSAVSGDGSEEGSANSSSSAASKAGRSEAAAPSPSGSSGSSPAGGPAPSASHAPAEATP